MDEKLKKIIWLQNIKKNVQREVKTDEILIISIKELYCHRILRRFQI